jgi:hypothetical protein
MNCKGPAGAGSVCIRPALRAWPKCLHGGDPFTEANARGCAVTWATDPATMVCAPCGRVFADPAGPRVTIKESGLPLCPICLAERAPALSQKLRTITNAGVGFWQAISEEEQAEQAEQGRHNG